ncbi:hypothetical protein Tco_1467006 [Tanacetum coccineum]
MSVLTALLASPSMKMNSRYTALVAFNTRLREKIKRKASYLTELRFESSDLEEKHEKVQLAEAEAATTRSADELARTDAKLSDQALHRFDDLRSEVTRFVSSDIDSLVRGLLSSDEFSVTLASILSLAITSGVKKGAEDEFNKAVAALPSTYFPFLAKIAEVAESALLEVVSIQPNKIARSAVPAFAPATSLPVGETFGWTFTLEESRLTWLAPNASLA